MKKVYLSVLLILGFFSSQAQAVISGHVYNDLNGGTTIENTASPYALPIEPLVAVLVRPTVDTIVAVSSITTSTGAFSFGTRPPGSYYVMVITPSSVLSPGSTAPEIVLETGWVRTGETVSGTTTETPVNGRTNSFALSGTTPVSGILFGIQRRPFADRKMNALINKTTTTETALSVNTGSAFTKGGSNILSAKDSSGGTILHYTINVLPRFGTLYLGTTPVTTLAQVDTLTATEFATLAYLPGAAALNEEQDHFTYYATDNGLAKSNNAAYVIPFGLTDSDLDLIANRNDLDDDNDGILDTTECSLMNFGTVFASYTAGGFDFINPSDVGLSVMHRVGINISEDISSSFGKPAGSVIVNITNANTHPTSDVFYTNDSTGATQWSISGTLGNFAVLTHGIQFFSFDTRTITLLNGTSKRYIAAQTRDNLAQANWFASNDGYSWWLNNNNALTSPVSTGSLVVALTDPEPKYFEMASTANNRNEWATYYVEIKLECDDDNDGIPNRLDLDSDNDGCPDAIEGGGNVVVDDLVDASAPLAVGFGSTSDVVNLCGLPSCVDINGIPSLVTSTGQTIGTAQNPAQQSIICTATIVAMDDDYTATPANGIAGNPSVGNILTNDSLNDVVNVDIDSVAITVVTPATPNVTGANIPFIDIATGVVSVPGNTPSGSYDITYAICYTEVANVCDTAVVTVLVANPIVAIDNDYGMVNPSATGITTASVLGNDSLGGVVVNPANVTVATTGVVPAGFTLNADGTVTIAAGTPPGNYSFDYTICEIGANPANCSAATVTLTIPSVVAMDDDYTPTPANGIEGNPNVGNILTNDSLNDVVNVDIDSVAITVVTPATPNATGANTPSIDVATGVVSVPANTPSGSYDITYAICYTEVANVCDTAVVTVLVANPIVAIDNDYGTITPPTVDVTFPSVLANDSLGGVVLDPTDVTITAASALPAGFTLNPDGTVTVAAGTPIGSYSFDYTICEIGANPPSCSTATATLIIDEPTPVTMLYFDANRIEETVLLQWAIANEQNNKGFDVQRSADSRNWMSIGFVNSSALNGNSTERIDYDYKDLQPLNGVNYYRLMQTDIDGKYEYSVVRQVSFTANSAIAIHPNPATEYVMVSGITGNETIMVYDAVGKVVKTAKANSTAATISLDGLSAGTYHISIVSNTGKAVSKKVIKL